MKRLVTVLIVALALLAACDGGSPSISDDGAARLRSEVAAVRTAVGARDADAAARALDILRASVSHMRRSGDLSADRAATILDAAAAVDAELVSITTTTTTTTTTVPVHAPPGKGDEEHGKGQDKSNGHG